MKIRLLPIVCLLALHACKPAPEQGQAASGPGHDPATEPTQVTEPMPEKRPHELTIHGHTRVDEYYWLRDDSRSDPEVLAYLEQENAWFDAQMAHTKELQASLYEEMTGRLDPDDSGVPYEKNGFWYYYRYEPGNEYAIYARREGSMEAEEEILLDGNARAGDSEFYGLRGFEVTDDHRYVAFAEDFVGRRINTIRILDTETGELLPDTIGNAEGALAWSADGRYLFYLDKHPETLLAYRLMRHELGTDPAEDVLVYEEPDNTFYNWVSRSRSGEYLVLQHGNTDTSEVQLLRADDPTGEFKPFLPREEGHEYGIDHAKGRFFIMTNWQARNFRVMAADLETSADKSTWRELIPHREEAMVSSIQAFDDWLVVGERKDGLRKVRVLAHDGSVDRYLDATDEASIMWPSTNVNTDTDRVRYGFSSPITPTQTWEIDLNSGESVLLKADRILGDFDSANYRTARLSVEARDGKQVPVSLAYHKDTPLDGSAPALVYSYGSYGSSTDPWFRNSVVSLLDRGFVYAIAHIRGGQELGRQWYEDGKLMNKKNTFTDFIDVTAALQEQGKIDPGRTYARGGSAGGLLMGAVLNMAPELYHGVVANVPFVDVVTTMLDDSIPLTTGEFKEWGDPKEKEAYEYMLSYSPYDQVSAQDYPNLMVTTGLHDSQVQYFEPAKWVARLRDRRTDDNRLIFHTDMNAGHSGASGRYRQYLETAREYAFMVDLAGMEK
ncbi:MAG: prolyl oligopeptidase family serine peptidase [Xanthomonadales bacterium]|nr:S9 family peptidase [Xanthomonadales bacterium]NIX11930.1 prolyl oligopeptidase family serine peptidase [Xanthomonadales bacterium]